MNWFRAAIKKSFLYKLQICDWNNLIDVKINLTSFLTTFMWTSGANDMYRGAKKPSDHLTLTHFLPTNAHAITYNCHYHCLPCSLLWNICLALLHKKYEMLEEFKAQGEDEKPTCQFRKNLDKNCLCPALCQSCCLCHIYRALFVSSKFFYFRCLSKTIAFPHFKLWTVRDSFSYLTPLSFSWWCTVDSSVGL